MAFTLADCPRNASIRCYPEVAKQDASKTENSESGDCSFDAGLERLCRSTGGRSTVERYLRGREEEVEFGGPE